MQQGIPVDAVISDLEMPRRDGFGLLASIKNQPHWPQTPIIILTPRTEEKHCPLAFFLGVFLRQALFGNGITPQPLPGFKIT